MGMGRGLDRQLMAKNGLRIFRLKAGITRCNNCIRPSHLPLQGRAASGSVSKAQGRESWILTYRNRGVYFLSAT